MTDRDSAELAVIDPGDNAETISTRMKASGGEPRYILLTHGHHDHLGAAYELCKRTGLPCSIHRADVPLLRRAPLYAMSFDNREMVTPDAIVPFDGAQTFGLGGSLIEAWSTAGHTPGSVCFVLGACVFTGDTLLKGRLGRTDLPGGNGDQIVRSVDSLMSRLADGAVILPGHGSPWSQTEARTWWGSARSTVGAEADAEP